MLFTYKFFHGYIFKGVNPLNPVPIRKKIFLSFTHLRKNLRKNIF